MYGLSELLIMSEEAIDTEDEAVGFSFDLNSSMTDDMDMDHIMVETFC